MKKIRLIGIFGVILALFAFAGCDAILESFYPEFAEGAQEGDFGVGIWVQIVVPAGEAVNIGQPVINAVAVPAWDPGAPPVAQTKFYPGLGFNDGGDTIFEGYLELYFGNADMGGDYKILVWGEDELDTQGFPGVPDPQEPQGEAYWWTPDGFQETIFSFWPGDDNYSPWISGEAYIIAGSPNDLFNVNGHFVLDEYEKVTKDYIINVANADKIIRDFEWRIYDASGFEYMYGWHYDIFDTIAYFSVDYTNANILDPADATRLRKGDYWLEVVVFYDDNSSRPIRTPVRIVAEAGSGTNFEIHLNIWGVPGQLQEGNSYYIDLYRVTPDGTESYLRSEYATVNNGDINFNAGVVLSYNPTHSTAGDFDSTDSLKIVIDMNEDTFENAGDFSRTIPLGLDVNDPIPGLYRQITFDLEGRDILPVF